MSPFLSVGAPYLAIRPSRAQLYVKIWWGWTRGYVSPVCARTRQKLSQSSEEGRSSTFSKGHMELERGLACSLQCLHGAYYYGLLCGLRNLVIFCSEATSKAWCYSACTRTDSAVQNWGLARTPALCQQKFWGKTHQSLYVLLPLIILIWGDIQGTELGTPRVEHLGWRTLEWLLYRSSVDMI